LECAGIDEKGSALDSRRDLTLRYLFSNN